MDMVVVAVVVVLLMTHQIKVTPIMVVQVVAVVEELVSPLEMVV